MGAATETDELVAWSTLEGEEWPTLLIGNGLSINIWRKFGYPELRAQARLDNSAAQLFSDLGTANFEEVLESLWHAERVAAALSLDAQAISELYSHVRGELVQAIQRVHVKWNSIPSTNLGLIAAALDKHSAVFTLNYDLITYWALMNSLGTTEIVDFFWNNPFSPSDTRTASASATRLLFLHGGIHLWQDTVTGATGKWKNQQPGGLLSQFGEVLASHPDRIPLIVSEGRSEEKMRAIRRSDYLSFAYQELSENTSPTIIFGASFGPQDDHIVKALRKGAGRRIGISIFPFGDPAEVVAAKATYRAKLPDQDLQFFDSTTHPLGDPGLRITGT